MYLFSVSHAAYAQKVKVKVVVEISGRIVLYRAEERQTGRRMEEKETTRRSKEIIKKGRRNLYHIYRYMRKILQ